MLFLRIEQLVLSFLTLRIKPQPILRNLAHLNKLTYLLHFLLLALFFVPRCHNELFGSFTRRRAIIELFLKLQVLFRVDEVTQISAKLLKVDVFVYLKLLVLS